MAEQVTFDIPLIAMITLLLIGIAWLCHSISKFDTMEHLLWMGDDENDAENDVDEEVTE